MKRQLKLFILMSSLLFLFVSMSGFTYALPSESFYAPTAVSRISITVDRTTSSKASVSISGSTSSMASSLTMTATLYEYNSGKLTKVNGSSITKTTKNCTSYNFDTNFNLSPNKSYKVTAVITDVTNGVSTTTSKTSNTF